MQGLFCPTGTVAVDKEEEIIALLFASLSRVIAFRARDDCLLSLRRFWPSLTTSSSHWPVNVSLRRNPLSTCFCPFVAVSVSMRLSFYLLPFAPN